MDSLNTERSLTETLTLIVEFEVYVDGVAVTLMPAEPAARESRSAAGLIKASSW